MTTYNNIPFTTDETFDQYFEELNKEIKEIANFFEKEREWLETIKE